MVIYRIVTCWKILILLLSSPIQMWISARLLKPLHVAFFPCSKIIVKTTNTIIVSCILIFKYFILWQQSASPVVVITEGHNHTWRYAISVIINTLISTVDIKVVALKYLPRSEFLLHCIPNPRSRGVVTRLRAHCQVKAIRFPAEARDYSCKYPDCFSGQPSLQFHTLRGLFPRRWSDNGNYPFTSV